MKLVYTPFLGFGGLSYFFQKLIFLHEYYSSVISILTGDYECQWKICRSFQLFYSKENVRIAEKHKNNTLKEIMASSISSEQRNIFVLKWEQYLTPLVVSR